MNEETTLKLLRQTLGIVKEADVPNDLKAAAFDRVWTALSGGQPKEASDASNASDASDAAAEGDGKIAALAAKMSVKADLVNENFEIGDEGSLIVRVPSQGLPDSKSAATVSLALLVCAGRQIVTGTATPAKYIRVVCDDYNKLDGGNFATAMKAGDKWWTISGSGGAKREYKLRLIGWEEAGRVLATITGV